MKVCEVCGSKEQEDNEAELNRRVLYVCEDCIDKQGSKIVNENG